MACKTIGESGTSSGFSISANALRFPASCEQQLSDITFNTLNFAWLLKQANQVPDRGTSGICAIAGYAVRSVL